MINPTNPKRDSKIKQVQGHVVGTGSTKDHLVKIQPVTEYQKYGHKSYRSIVAFGAAFHEDQQGSHEVDDQVQIEDPHIGAFETGLEVNGLFRDIRIPDQHELVKPEIGPEDREGKLELTEVMQVLLVDIFQVSLVLQIHYEQGDQGYTGYKSTGESIPAVHRRKPAGVETHQPQPWSYGGNGQRKPYDEYRGPYRVLKDVFLGFCKSEGSIVDRTGEAAQFIAQGGPQTDGQNRPNSKEGRLKGIRSFL